jgi:hypothetical protein
VTARVALGSLPPRGSCLTTGARQVGCPRRPCPQRVHGSGRCSLGTRTPVARVAGEPSGRDPDRRSTTRPAVVSDPRLVRVRGPDWDPAARGRGRAGRADAGPRRRRVPVCDVGGVRRAAALASRERNRGPGRRGVPDRLAHRGGARGCRDRREDAAGRSPARGSEGLTRLPETGRIDPPGAGPDSRPRGTSGEGHRGAVADGCGTRGCFPGFFQVLVYRRIQGRTAAREGV